jgi:hypothetical protein
LADFTAIHNSSKLVRIEESMMKCVNMADFTAIHNSSKLVRIEESMMKCVNMTLGIVNFFMNAEVLSFF